MAEEKKGKQEGTKRHDFALTFKKSASQELVQAVLDDLTESGFYGKITKTGPKNKFVIFIGLDDKDLLLKEA